MLAAEYLEDDAWMDVYGLSGGGARFTYCESLPGPMLELGVRSLSGTGYAGYSMTPGPCEEYDVSVLDIMAGVRFEVYADREEPGHFYFSGGACFQSIRVEATTIDGELQESDGAMGLYLSAGWGSRHGPVYTSIGLHWRVKTTDVEILDVKADIESTGFELALGFAW
jgi:hypothetical protein